MSSEAAMPGSSAQKLKTWLHALRAPFLTASGIPVLLGAFAVLPKGGGVNPARLFLALGSVLCVHLGANLANDFFDEMTGCDRQNPEPTTFSGGSRVIQRGLIPARSIIVVSLVFFGLALVQGLWLNSMVPGNTVLAFGIVGLGIGLLYSALPVKLSYRGLGEVAIFFAFGPLVVVGSYVCQTGAIEAYPFWVSVPAGLLVLSILLVNEVLDHQWDSLAGKRTLVVMLGRSRGYLLFLLTYLGAYLWIGWGLAWHLYPTVAVVALVPLPIIMPRLLPDRALADRQALIRASGLVILSHMAVTGLLAVSYLIDG
jgi:1,4-dihydroxy-2-naphthoate octaprenyltransferase